MQKVLSDVSYDRKNTSFPITVHSVLGSKKWDPTTGEQYHQFLFKEFVANFPTTRGQLIFYDMGQGKTRTVLSGLLQLKQASPEKRIILIAPKAIKNFYLEELEKIEQTINGQKEVEKEKKEPSIVMATIADVRNSIIDNFIALKASNLIDQLETKTLFSHGLDNCILVIDEAHNLFNSICNGSRNAVALYDTIMATKKLQLFFLSGTPAINEPYELAVCFNMLAGETIFPESRDNFNNAFVEKSHAKNIEVFKNRIVGLVSYKGADTVKQEGTPEELKTKVVLIPMSDLQYGYYKFYRDKEKEETRRKMSRKKTVDRFRTKGTSSSYRVKSRMVSNVFPFDGITDDDLKDIHNHSPKIEYAYRKIGEYPNNIGAIYCDFVGDGGLATVARYLELKGWKNVSEEAKSDTNGGATTKMKVKDAASAAPSSFAILSGDVDLADRTRIIDIFNSADNIRGEKIKLLLLGPAVAEAISLKNAVFIIIMGPFFNYIRIEQATKRIVRFKSHQDLPENERKVQPYILLADYPKSVHKQKEPTTDFVLYAESKQRSLLNKEFFKLLADASINCIGKTCKLCQPTNELLYNNDLSYDPCKPYVPQKLKLDELEVEINGEKIMFGYTQDKGIYNFFRFDAKVQAYVQVKRNDPLFPTLIDAIEKA